MPEAGVQAPKSAATIALSDDDAVQEHFHARGWTDGLPIVAPTAGRVAAHLDWAGMPPDHLVGIEPVRSRALTAEKVAINAVMAGCTPMDFPVVVTALSAMLHDDFLLHGATASTGGCAVLLIVNGPIRQQLGMNSGFNALGSSDRSAVCIGRAVRLVLRNLLEVRPGEIDRSTIGHPGKIGWCIAEDEESSPWPSLATHRLGVTDEVSAVTAVAAMAPRQIMNEWTTDPAEILETYAAEMRANMTNYSIWGGDYTIVIPPQLREHFASAGWSRDDIAARIHDRAHIHRRDWAEVGKAAVVEDKGDRRYDALPDRESLLIVAAGGPAGGFGAVIPPWLGTKSRAVTMAVGACVDC